MSLKSLVTNSLIFIFLSTNLSADRWHRHYPRYRYNNYSYNQYRSHSNRGITPGAATAIGLGVGVLGFVIGRSTKSKEKEVIYKDSPKIECKEFDMMVSIEGEQKKAKVTKCRTENGEWRIPE